MPTFTTNYFILSHHHLFSDWSELPEWDVLLLYKGAVHLVYSQIDDDDNDEDNNDDDHDVMM